VASKRPSYRVRLIPADPRPIFALLHFCIVALHSCSLNRHGEKGEKACRVPCRILFVTIFFSRIDRPNKISSTLFHPPRCFFHCTTVQYDGPCMTLTVLQSLQTVGYDAPRRCIFSLPRGKSYSICQVRNTGQMDAVYSVLVISMFSRSLHPLYYLFLTASHQH